MTEVIKSYVNALRKEISTVDELESAINTRIQNSNLLSNIDPFTKIYIITDSSYYFSAADLRTDDLQYSCLIETKDFNTVSVCTITEGKYGYSVSFLIYYIHDDYVYVFSMRKYGNEDLEPRYSVDYYDPYHNSNMLRSAYSNQHFHSIVLQDNINKILNVQDTYLDADNQGRYFKALFSRYQIVLPAHLPNFLYKLEEPFDDPVPQGISGVQYYDLPVEDV